MKKWIFAMIFCFSLTTAQHNYTDTTLQLETKKTKKNIFNRGTMFVFWGWNRALFSGSDIHFKGADYNFHLYNVKAYDRPTELSWAYVDPGQISAPQFNFKLAYFIKDNLALVLAQDHMKYVMDQEQTTRFSGNISDPTYANKIVNGYVDLTDAEFLTFEHTDGLNYVNLGLEKYHTLYSSKNIDVVGSYGAGIGALIPKSNVTLFGNERSDRFHIAGFGTDFRASMNVVFWNRWMAKIEGKFGYINMPDVKTTLNNKPDYAEHDFVFGQVNFGIGYIFNQKNHKKSNKKVTK